MRPTPRSTAIALAMSLTFALAALPAAALSRPMPEKPSKTVVDVGRDSQRVIVKFAEGSEIKLRAGRFAARESAELLALDAILARFGAEPNRLAGLTEERVATQRRLAATRSRLAVPDLNLYFDFALPGEDAAALCDALNALELVELAFPAPLPAPPPGDIPPVTPDFRALQGYRRPATDGVDAAYAAHFPGGRGEAVFIIDVEYDWYDQHEDLSAALGQKLVYTPAGNWPDHGTSVLGEMIADDDGFGVTGIVPGARVGMVTQDPVGMSNSVARAIIAATELLEAGDLLLMETQTWGPEAAYVPSEWDQDVFDAVFAATAKGIIVVEAGGNGGKNLDAPIYAGRFDRTVRDSGAIIVGAGAPPNSWPADRSRLSFSSHGSRIDVQGWGQGVMTTGEGDHWSGDSQHRQDYTDTFNGTSSASPIVTGAAAAVQSVWRTRGEAPLSPTALRQLLTDTGSPQMPGAYSGNIGPRPDVRGALRQLLGGVLPNSHVLDDSAGGNGDNALDPGEELTLSICLWNAGSETADAVFARAGSPAPSWLKIIGDDASYGSLAPDSEACSGAPHYRLVVEPDAPCGARVHVPLALRSSLGTSETTLGLVVGTDGNCTPRTCADPEPVAVPATMTVTRSGDDLVLDWEAVTGASGYRVWRSAATDFDEERIAGSAAVTSVTLPGLAAEAEAFTAMLVRAHNSCGWEGP